LSGYSSRRSKIEIKPGQTRLLGGRDDSGTSSFPFPFAEIPSRERVALTGLIRALQVLIDSVVLAEDEAPSRGGLAVPL
jgi:hypothetical protein